LLAATSRWAKEWGHAEATQQGEVAGNPAEATQQDAKAASTLGSPPPSPASRSSPASPEEIQLAQLVITATLTAVTAGLKKAKARNREEAIAAVAAQMAGHDFIVVNDGSMCHPRDFLYEYPASDDMYCGAGPRHVPTYDEATRVSIVLHP
jgi:hypothetical protein